MRYTKTQQRTQIRQAQARARRLLNEGLSNAPALENADFYTGRNPTEKELTRAAKSAREFLKKKGSTVRGARKQTGVKVGESLAKKANKRLDELERVTHNGNEVRRVKQLLKQRGREKFTGADTDLMRRFLADPKTDPKKVNNIYDNFSDFFGWKNDGTAAEVFKVVDYLINSGLGKYIDPSEIEPILTQNVNDGYSGDDLIGIIGEYYDNFDGDLATLGMNIEYVLMQLKPKTKQKKFK